MNLLRIPIANLKPLPGINMRREIDSATPQESVIGLYAGDSSLAALADDILATAKRRGADHATDGLIQPLDVVATGPDTYGIVDGLRRFSALMSLVESGKLVKDATVPCSVADKDSEAEALILESVSANLQRKRPRQYELAAACAMLRDKCKLSPGQIGARVHYSETYVKPLLAAHDHLIPAAREAWETGTPALSWEIIKKLAFMKATEQEREWQKMMTPATSGSTPGSTSSGKNKSKKPRPSGSRLAKVREIAEKSAPNLPDIDAAFMNGVAVCLKWCMGDLAEIPGIPDSAKHKPKPPKSKEKKAA